MQPSSLIFFVIVAIWVAYLIQHWVRRREHLATARSVDRFSEAMRVLERRTPLPTTMLAGATPPPSATSHAASVVRAAVSSPLRARHGATGVSGSGQPAGPVHAVPPIELVPHRTTTEVVLRRARGVFFLAALVAVPATLVLSAAHILKWLSLALAVAALLVAVAWLRLSAVQEQKARHARRAQLRRLDRLRVGDAAPLAPLARPVRPRTAETVAAPAPAVPVAPVAPEAVAPARVPEVEREVDPGAWQPVPVPPPTYTLKEPAYRPEPALRPVPIEVEDDEIEVMATLPGRRVVGH